MIALLLKDFQQVNTPVIVYLPTLAQHNITISDNFLKDILAFYTNEN